MRLKKNGLKNTLIVLITCFASISYGQNLMNNNWFFGYNAGLNFNTSPAPAVSIGGWASVAQEASSAISDSATGSLLFYTNSDTIYDASHSPMPNGMNLLGGGHSSHQGVIIVPDPGNPDRYYVFSVGQGDYENAIFNPNPPPAPANWMPPYGGLAYHVVDMTLNGGMGDLTSKDNILYLADSLTMFESRVTAAIHGNGQDYWIIVRRDDGTGTWNFYSYLLNASGVQPPVKSAASQTGEGFGSMKVSPDGSRIAITGGLLPPNTGPFDPLYFEVFCFNNQNGKATYLNKFVGGPLLNIAISFSPNSKLLYFAPAGTALHQIELATNTIVQISNSSLSEMQLGIDGRIYVNASSSSLALIDQPNVVGTGCNYLTNAIPLTSGATYTGMCNIINAYEVSVQITADYTSLVADPCDSLTVSFLDGTTGPADQWAWTILNGVGDTVDTSNLQNPIVVFDSAGTYSVQLVSYFDCLTDTMVKPIFVGTGTKQTTNNFTVCTGDSIQLPDGSFVSDSGTYYDTLTAASSCDSVIITNLIVNTVYSITVDTMICDGSSIYLSGAYQNTAGTYYDTFVSSGNCDSVVITNLEVSPVYDTSYTIDICEGDSVLIGGVYQNSSGTYYDSSKTITGCDSLMAINLIVNTLPSLQLTSDTVILLGETINLFVTGASNYLWSTGETSASINVSPSQSTTYSVTGTTQGCASIGLVTITVIVQANNIYVPNVFALSSNQEEHNKLYVYGGNIATYEFLIYDRWGEVVFETSDVAATIRQDGLCCKYGPGWDGTFKNKEEPLNSNVFAYKLTGTFNNGEEFFEAGNITLLK